MNSAVPVSKCFAVLLLLALCAAFHANAQQALKFADIFTDNMVLQRGKPVVCWGWASAGKRVEVLLTQSRRQAVAFAGEAALVREAEEEVPPSTDGIIGNVRITYQENSPAPFTAVSKTAVAAADGRWQVELGVHAASFAPTYLAARCGDAAVAVQNLLIGEVWIASGQSNMEWAWTQDKMWENRGLIFNGVRYAKIRGDSQSPREAFVDDSVVGRGKAFEPWIVCEDGAVNSVSTIPYLFGQYLHRRLKVPVGIINIAQGGSFAREWCTRQLLEQMQSPTVEADLAGYDERVRKDPQARYGRGPSSLINARLYPFRHLTVAGVIYLQGENEAIVGDLPQYTKTFPGVIESYRTLLAAPDLPFGIITLQGMGLKSTGMDSGAYPVARAIHKTVHERTANTGYIVAHDVGGGIHPAWKRPVAERTVYWALRDVYHVLDRAERTRMKRVSFQNRHALVEFESVQLENGQWTGAKAVLPKTNNQQPYAGFMIAGPDRVWYPGRITVNEEGPAGLLVSHPLVRNPVALRYAWDGYSPGNLGAWEDPVAPFRTDDWPVVAPDAVYDETSGQPSAAERKYLRANEVRNLELETALQVAVADSFEQLIKRYAHPKGMLLDTVGAMQQMLENFEIARYEEQSPALARQALHSIPCRYWQRDKYTPVRKAKWSWLLERVIRFRDLPQNMEQTLERPGVRAKLAQLQHALGELQAELEQLPDPDSMEVDAMLDVVLPVMEQESERLSQEGVDMKKQKRALSVNPF